MFWNLFKFKKNTTTNESYKTWISYAIDEKGLVIDINIENFSENSLDDFAKLLAGVSTMSFVTDTVAVVKEGLASRPEAYEFLMSKAIIYAQQEVKNIMNDLNNIEEDQDAPVIKPSDVLK